MSNIETRIALQQSRFFLIQQTTDYDTEDDTSQSSRQSLNTRLEMLELNWEKFQEGHEGLCLSTSDDLQGHEYFKSRIFERCQAFYVHAKSKFLTQRDELDVSNIPSRSESSDIGITSGLSRRLGALPRITLPHFSGDYQEWRSFYDLFSSLIRNNTELSNVEKMHYLKTSLSGEAARMVSNLSVSGDHFSIAWDTLVSRYENKRLLISTHLDRLVNLKPLKPKSAQGLSTFLSTITETLGALRALGCRVEFWDTLLLHLLVRILDSESREAWKVKLGSSTSPPTFAQFEDFLMGRTRALQNLHLSSTISSNTRDRFESSTGASRTRITAHIATSSNVGTTASCTLCESKHYLSNCPIFQTKTVSQRFNIVKEQRRCYNCLGFHTASQCRNTKRCQKCGRRHHTLLHESLGKLAKMDHTSSSRDVSNDNVPSASSSS